MPSMKQIRAMPQWVARSGASTLTVRAVDITQARERCAKIGMREPSSIVIKTDPAGDARAAAEAFAALALRGMRPVRNPCKCAELGD